MDNIYTLIKHIYDSVYVNVIHINNIFINMYEHESDFKHIHNYII